MNANTMAPDIGRIVKEARKSLGLTLERLSERTGVSKSMLSAIERGATNPTFSIVWSLKQALGIDLGMLEGDIGSDEPIEHLHHYSTPMRRSEDGKCELYMLSPRRTVLPVEWHRLIMRPGARLESSPHALGTYEHLTCLSGALSVTVEGRIVSAGEGDTLRYGSDCLHCITNIAEGVTEALLLVAQPTQYQDAPMKA